MFSLFRNPCCSPSQCRKYQINYPALQVTTNVTACNMALIPRTFIKDIATRYSLLFHGIEHHFCLIGQNNLKERTMDSNKFRLGLTNVRSNVQLLGHWLIMIGQLFNIYNDWSCWSLPAWSIMTSHTWPLVKLLLLLLLLVILASYNFRIFCMSGTKKLVPYHKLLLLVTAKPITKMFAFFF
jgi:hypothetical protein